MIITYLHAALEFQNLLNTSSSCIGTFRINEKFLCIGDLIIALL